MFRDDLSIFGELKKEIAELKQSAKDDAEYIKTLEKENRSLKEREKIRIKLNDRLRHELKAANEKLEYLEERPQPKISLERLIEEKVEDALRARERRVTLEDIRMGARY